MRSRKLLRSLALLAMTSLVVGIFVAAPAEAKKKKKGCATYAPGENGAGQEVTLVTDAATEDKPAEVELQTPPGLGAGRDTSGPEGMNVGQTYTNLQVDSAAKTGNLYVQIAWDVPVFDYDVYLDTSDGTELANSAGFGPVTSGSDYAASGVGTETITAFPVNDCDGFTADVVSATTPGGAVTIRYWLGE